MPINTSIHVSSRTMLGSAGSTSITCHEAQQTETMLKSSTIQDLVQFYCSVHSSHSVFDHHELASSSRKTSLTCPTSSTCYASHHDLLWHKMARASNITLSKHTILTSSSCGTRKPSSLNFTKWQRLHRTGQPPARFDRRWKDSWKQLDTAGNSLIAGYLVPLVAKDSQRRTQNLWRLRIATVEVQF